MYFVFLDFRKVLNIHFCICHYQAGLHVNIEVGFEVVLAQFYFSMDR